MHTLLTAPKKLLNIYSQVQETGLDVARWHKTRDGSVLVNGWQHRYWNGRWAFFGASTDPIVLTLAYKDIQDKHLIPYFKGNERVYCKSHRPAPSEDQKEKASELQAAVYQAFVHSAPVRVITVVYANEDSTDEKVKARQLDPETWWVHSFDDASGDYHIVRGLEPPTPDVAADPAFQSFLKTLDETQRDAAIKARVGQGPFRDRLYRRWQGCSVTNVTMKSLLTASHIRPWSKCEDPNHRTGPSNGLLLIPTLDRLFDRGYISFDDDFQLIVSSQLPEKYLVLFGLHAITGLRQLNEPRDDLREHLTYHREHIFDKRPGQA